MNNQKYNLSELVMSFYNSGWIINKFEFKLNEWNELGYYLCPDLIHISVKLIDYDNIIIRMDFADKKLYRLKFDGLCGMGILFDEYQDQLIMLINKARKYQEKLNDILSDFEE